MYDAGVYHITMARSTTASFTRRAMWFIVCPKTYALCHELPQVGSKVQLPPTVRGFGIACGH